MTPLRVLWQTAVAFVTDEVERHGAALAFYALFTVAPLLVIATGVAGLVFGEVAVTAQVSRQLGTLLTPDAAALVERMVASAAQPGASLQATAIGIMTLVFGATRGFHQLQASLNTIWGVRPKPRPPVQAVRLLLVKRLLSFVAVLAVGLLLALSLLASVALSVAGAVLQARMGLTDVALGWAQAAVDSTMLWAFLAVMYKVFPDVDVHWRDVGLGAAVATVLLVVARSLFFVYVTSTAVTSGFGPAGSLVALMLLSYVSALALLFGAEFTQAWAAQRGRPIVPSSGAVERYPGPRLGQNPAGDGSTHPTG